MNGLRRAAATLTLVLASSALVACSGDDEADGPGTPTTSTTPAPPRTPVAGDCHRMTWDEALAPSASTEKERCRRPTAITFHVGTLATKKSGETRRPDSRAVQRQMARVCPQQLDEFIGGDVESRRLSILTTIWFTPTPEQVEAGADWFRCDLVAPGTEETLVPLQPPMKSALDDDGRRDRYALCAAGQPGTESFTRVPCSAQHTWQAVSTVDLTGDDYPGPDELDAQLKQPCTDAAVDSATDPLDLSWHQEVPTRAQWQSDQGQSDQGQSDQGQSGQRYGVCWLPTG